MSEELARQAPRPTHGKPDAGFPPELVQELEARYQYLDTKE